MVEGTSGKRPSSIAFLMRETRSASTGGVAAISAVSSAAVDCTTTGSAAGFAASTLLAAATGATLQVIRSRGSATDPYVQSLRDAVIARLTGMGPDQVTNNYVEIARHLLLVLPDSEVSSLRPSELSLLRDWLNRITVV